MFAVIARWVPGLGLVFAVLVLVATFLTDQPRSDASDETIRNYYLDGSSRDAETIAFLLIGLAAVCFLQFLGSLRGVLAKAEGEPARITTAAIGSGVAFITLAVASHAAGTAITFAVELYDERFTVDPNTVRIAIAVKYGLFVLALFAAAAMALATATIALSMRAFPGWLGWLSVLAVLAGLLGIFWLPAVVVLLWIAVLSLHMVWPAAQQPERQPSQLA